MIKSSTVKFNKIAIIAGDGDLPLEVISSVERMSIKYVIVLFNEVSLKIKNDKHVIRARFEEIYELFCRLHRLDVDAVTFCGYVKKPELHLGLISNKSKEILGTMIKKLGSTDEVLFGEILKKFKENHFNLVGLSCLLPSAFCDEGIFTRKKPSKVNINDAIIAKKTFNVFSKTDLGQSLVISDGSCIALETSVGTDLMLSALKNYIDLDLYKWKGGVFYKAPKIGQNKVIDTPVIGEETVKAVKNAGLDGIVIESNNVIVLNKLKTFSLAEKLGLFLWSMK